MQNGIEYLKLAERVLNNSFDLKLKLSQALFQNNQTEECIESAQRALQLSDDSNSFDAHMLYGKALLRNREASAAAFQFKMVIDLCDSSDMKEKRLNAMFYLGQSYDMQQNFPKAIETFKRALFEDEKFITAAVHLATVLQVAGDDRRSMRYYLHALDVDPDCIAANYGLARLIGRKKALARDVEEDYSNSIKTKKRFDAVNIDSEQED